MSENDESANFHIFRDCISTPLIEKSADSPAKARRKSRGNGTAKTVAKSMAAATTTISDNTDDAEELAEFIDYLATEIFTTLPPELRTLTYSTYINTPRLQTQYPLPLPHPTASSILSHLSPNTTETLSTYSLLPRDTSPTEFLTPVLTSYLTQLTSAPPPPSLTRSSATGCELCLRSWIPLTYHHLIPRAVHGKAVKRGWHTADQLGNVAWLCRACHSFVHRVASNEELAREFYTAELLGAREDVRAFGEWVGRLRWQGR